jgi:hypothetical protein
MRERDLLVLGWREWVGLPELALPVLKAKVDTGARTSALHAFELEHFVADQRPCVRFSVHPIQGRDDLVVRCSAPLVEQREVTDSGGHRELRPVIATQLQLGEARWPIELTLTDRDSMRFRMLVGRTALSGRALVDVRRSYLSGQPDDPVLPYSGQPSGEGGR